MQTISFDLEWSRHGIDVLGLAWNEGRQATATHKDDQSLRDLLGVLHSADRVAGHNIIDADLAKLEEEGTDISTLLPKAFDTRLAFHAVNAHLAGTGSFDLRSVVLLSGARHGERFPLDFKKYESDLHETCAMDAAAVAWVEPGLQKQITQNRLEKTVTISHSCARIFSLMHKQGVRMDTAVLTQIHAHNKNKTLEIVEKYHLYEERGKKKIKKVPIWRSMKVLDIFQEQFGVRPKDRKRVTWVKLSNDSSISPEARQFAAAIVDLGKGANDATFVGKAEADDEGDLSFSKLDENGFIHPRYDICGSPDRAIASGPNIAQYPRPKDDPRPVKLRSAVLPLDDSHILLDCDLGSAETYTNAVESDDWDRVRAIQSKTLSHEGTAAMINTAFGFSLNRDQGKVCNHAFDKGESPYNLARRIFGTDRPSRQQVLQCQQIFQAMLKEYPKTAMFRDKLWEMARTNPLVVTNSFGRRLMCFSRSKYGDSNDRWARHDPAKKYWCPCGECAPRRDRFKYAIAFLGRSSAFDVLLRVMARIFYEKRLDNYSLPLMEVHDELCYSVPIDKAEHYAKMAKETFQEPIPELGGLRL